MIGNWIATDGEAQRVVKIEGFGGGLHRATGCLFG